MGTRFLASDESPITAGHKQAITGAAAHDAVHFTALNDIFPQWVAGGYDVVVRAIRTPFVVVRAIRTPFIDEWEARRSEIEEQRSDLQSYMISKVSAGQSHEVLPGAGQSSGAITETKPAAQIVSDIMAEAEAALGSF
jgi:nitronate monooxygenase/enoyl-[acyl-carrier protein] reductase II